MFTPQTPESWASYCADRSLKICKRGIGLLWTAMPQKLHCNNRKVQYCLNAP